MARIIQCVFNFERRVEEIKEVVEKIVDEIREEGRRSISYWIILWIRRP